MENIKVVCVSYLNKQNTFFFKTHHIFVTKVDLKTKNHINIYKFVFSTWKKQGGLLRLRSGIPSREFLRNIMKEKKEEIMKKLESSENYVKELCERTLLALQPGLG